MKTSDIAKGVTWLGIVLIVAVGLIHFADAPGSFEDAAYKGWLFYVNALGALIAAIGIYRGSRSWGWTLGALIAGLSLVAYLASRTVGLPQIAAEPDAWLEPLGVASIVAEALFLIVYGWVMTTSSKRTTSASQQLTDNTSA